MKLPIFKLEEYLSQFEFSAPYLLCCSDAESLSMKQLLSFADPESKKLWDNLHLGYTEVPGLPVLRETIASLYNTIHAHDVLTFAGAEEGIYCTMQALLSPGDHVIAIVPAYQLMPSWIYDTSNNFFRIGFGRSNMPGALQLFSEFLIEEKLT